MELKKGDIVMFRGVPWLVATGYRRSDGLYKVYSLDFVNYAFLNPDLVEPPSSLMKELL